MVTAAGLLKSPRLPLFCRFPAAILFFLTVFLSPIPAPAASDQGYFFVEHVIDGDTVVIEGGDRVRYIGMDTPEEGEPFYAEAKERNLALVGGKRVRLVFCDSERRDRYGRLLAWVYTDGGVFVNRTLVEEGLARKFPVPPCGLLMYKEFKKAEEEARAKKRGLWSASPAERHRAARKTITPGEAHGHLGEKVSVRGTVREVKPGRDGVYIVFEGEGGFTAVVFSGLLKDLRMSGRDPAGLKGRVVTVKGRIRSYHGAPEMLLKRPADIKVE